MSHFKFTNMARNVCKILGNNEALKTGDIDIRQMPIGDVFKDCSFTAEEYELLGTTNKFFSSEYMKRVGKYIKDS